MDYQTRPELDDHLILPGASRDKVIESWWPTSDRTQVFWCLTQSTAYTKIILPANYKYDVLVFQIREDIDEKVQVLITQLCPTLCNPVDCSPPGSSVPEISQARIPEWIAISFSRGLVSPVLAGGFFISVPPGKSQIVLLPLLFFFFLSAKKRTCSYVFK